MTGTGGPESFRDEGGLDSGPKLKGPACLAQLLSWWAVPQFHHHCRPQAELWVTQAALTGVGVCSGWRSLAGGIGEPSAGALNRWQLAGPGHWGSGVCEGVVN